MKIQSILQTLTPTPASKVDRTRDEGLITGEKETAKSEVEKLFERFGRPLDAESSKAIERFFSKAEGTEASKIETLEIVLSKGMPVDEAHLNPIHQAILHDTKALETMMEGEVKGPELPVNAAAFLKLPKPIKEALEVLLKKGMPLPEALKQLALEYTGQRFTTLKEALAILQTKGIESLEIKSEENVTKVDFKSVWTTGGVESSFIHSGETQSASDHVPIAVESGKPVFERPATTFESAPTPREEQDLGPVETSEVLDESETIETEVIKAIEGLYETLEHFTREVESAIDVKLYLVKETTQATLSAQKTFDQFQKETLKILEKTPDMTKPQLAEAVAKVIDGLEKIILKSNVTLFTDMTMERDLLKSSSLLEKAKTLLNQGQVQEAKHLVLTVKSTVEKIAFQPSIQKIQGFSTFKAQELSHAFKEDNAYPLEQSAKQVLELLKGPQGVRQGKDVFEIMRFMGLNHEAEVVELMEGKPPLKNQDLVQDNVKALLLKMMKDETAHRTVDSKEQSMLNLSGQQMMNQPDQGDKKRHHLYNIPIEEGHTISNMKVVVSGRSQMGKLDPNNTELYFGFELKKYGEVGIKLTIRDGVVDLNVLTKQSNFDASLVFEPVMANLSSIGYQRGKINLEGATASKTLEPSVAKPAFTEKGFDYKI